MFDVHEMEVNFGPQHPSTHGVLRVILKIDGERIIDAKPIIGYLHRGTEKLFENMSYPMCIPHTDRMDYVASATNNLGFVETVEKLMGITKQIPKRAQLMRVMLSELQRISSHLLWLATHAIDIGAMTPFFYCFREREQVLDLFEEYCGARLTLNCMRIGGMPDDLPPGWLDDVEKFVDKFEDAVDEYESLLTNNRIWKKRTVGIGVISPEDAIDWGITGPPLRGSGVEWDLRRAQPYECYPELKFEIPIGKNGDTYDRYLVPDGRDAAVELDPQAVHPARESDAGGRHQSEDLESRAAARGRGLPLDRIAERGAGLLHRRRRQIAEGVSLPRAAAVIRESAGAAGDGEGTPGVGSGGVDRDD